MSALALKHKHDIHLGRKLWHVIGITVMALMYNLVPLRASWAIILILSVIFIPLDLLRKRHPGLNRLSIRIFGPVMRQNEIDAISGMTYLYLGCMFLLILNKRHIVTLSLLFLAFGDPLASYFGLLYGKDRILGSKTLQGTMAAFVTCTVVAGLYYYFNNLMTERLLIVVPLSGLIGALAELIPIGRIDDNFTFPVIGASLLWLLFTIYGGF